MDKEEEPSWECLSRDHSVSRAVTSTSSGPAEKPLQNASHSCHPAMLAGDLSLPVPTLTGGWSPPPRIPGVSPLNSGAMLTPRQRNLLVRSNPWTGKHRESLRQDSEMDCFLFRPDPKQPWKSEWDPGHQGI